MRAAPRLTDRGAVSYHGSPVLAAAPRGPGREASVPGNVGMLRGRNRRGWLPVLVVIAIAGCGTPSTAPKAPAQPFRGLTVTVAAVGDPAILATVAAQRGEWAASQGAEVAIRQGAVDPRSLQGVDLLVFPGDRLGDLVDAG